MPKTLTITLSDELAERVRAKVVEGQFASESDLVQASVLAFTEEQDDVDQWLRDEVLPVLDEMEADPANTYTVEQMQQKQAGRHATWLSSKYSKAS